MSIKLTNIQVFGNGEGEVYFQVNGKQTCVIVHESGELDLEGDALTDQEMEAVFEEFGQNAQVEQAFDAQAYE